MQVISIYISHLSRSKKGIYTEKDSTVSICYNHIFDCSIICYTCDLEIIPKSSKPPPSISPGGGRGVHSWSPASANGGHEGWSWRVVPCKWDWRYEPEIYVESASVPIFVICNWSKTYITYIILYLYPIYIPKVLGESAGYLQFFYTKSLKNHRSQGVAATAATAAARTAARTSTCRRSKRTWCEYSAGATSANSSWIWGSINDD